MIVIVTLDSNLCRIYHYNKSPRQLTLLKEINHPENKLKTSELISDKQGHYQAPNAGRGAYAPHLDAKDVKIDSFSREVANELNHVRQLNGFDSMVVVAPPHMMGLLQQHLDKHTKEHISKHITKDILHLNQQELLDFVHTNTKYSDE